MSRLGMTASLGGALREAHEAVEGLTAATRRLGERHASDHDVFHVSRTLGLKLDEATARLAAQGERFDVSLDAGEPDPERSGGPLAGLREKAAELTGSRPTAGVLLLADLRRFLGVASDASVACVVLAQGAQAAGDDELLAAVSAAHDVVLRTHRWALTRLKISAPQVLTGP